MKTNTSSILIDCIQQYDEMMKDLAHCRKKNLDRVKEIEICFQIASNYYQRMIQGIQSSFFETQQDEIIFFKKIKPLFLAEIEVCGLYTHAELFKGHAVPADLLAFYKRELQRLEKFTRDNGEFYTYILLDPGNNDAEFFTQFPGSALQSAYDGLMGTLLALQKYSEYIGQEMRQLESHS